MYRILPRVLQPEFPAVLSATGSGEFTAMAVNRAVSSHVDLGGPELGQHSGPGYHAAGRTVQPLREQSWLPDRHSEPALVICLGRGCSRRNESVAVGRLPDAKYVFHPGRVR